MSVIEYFNGKGWRRANGFIKEAFSYSYRGFLVKEFNY